MSEATTRLFATPAGVRLCASGALAEGAARGFVLQMRAGRFFGFALRRDGAVHGYVDRCPHAGVPLTGGDHDYLAADGAMIACRWHGALFESDTGLCVGGPCAGQRLTRWPVEERGGAILTASPAP